MKFVPVSVMVLLRYTLLGFVMLLKVIELRTVNALLDDATLADVGLLIVTSIPATPREVPDPITTAINELDITVHDADAAPEDGMEPTFALHV